MEEREDLFRDLCENARDLVQSVSPEGRFLYVNRAWLETLGYRAEEVAALTLSDVIHPDSREHCREVFGRLMAGEDIRRIEAVFRSREGRSIPVEGSIRCRFVDGAPFATRGIFRDVTDRQQAEEELSRLFELSLDMLCIAGTDGYLKQINPAFERILGYDRDEMLSRPFIEFVHPDDREATATEVGNLARGQPVVDFRNRYRAKDGTWRWLAWRSAPLPSRGLIYAVARDITEQKRTEELLTRSAAELARSNADLEQFASAASHDLRAPLRGIATVAEWLEEDFGGDLPGSARDHLDKLRSRVVKMETLIDDLLAYARAGRREGAVERVDTAGLVRDLASLLDPPAGLEVRAEPGLPVLETARAPLAQVLRNLIGNAVKHHDRERGSIVISAREVDSHVEFRVADDGPGIPAEFQAKAFDMFEKGAGSAAAGSGMGLAMVRRILDRVGGEVTLESSGRGTTVRFTWPRKLRDPEPAG